MLTREKLASVMTFDPEKGRFFWIEGAGRGKPAGKEVGSFDAHGYGQINVFGKIWKEHRLVWLWLHGEMPEQQVDHINHDRRDNRPENLRLADNMENHKNRPMQNSNKTGCPGVWYDRPNDRYRVYITVDKKRINLGSTKTLDDAIKMRMAANTKYGFHENHGVTVGRPKHKVLKALAAKLGIEITPGKMNLEEIHQMTKHVRTPNHEYG